MTQRERLTKLISDMQDGGNKQGDHIMHTGFISNEKLADYLLANGVIVWRMKCKAVINRLVRPKTCINCKYLMFSDFCGKCGKTFKGIVEPNDTCEHFERMKKATRHDNYVRFVAIKDFAGTLKHRASYGEFPWDEQTVTTDQIDELVKEMVGEKDDRT